MNIKEKVLDVALEYAKGKMLDDPNIEYHVPGMVFWITVNLVSKEGNNLFGTYIEIDLSDEDADPIANYFAGYDEAISRKISEEFSTLEEWAAKIQSITIDDAKDILDQSEEILDLNKSNINSNYGDKIQFSFEEIIQ